jgi:hypothetical protein
MRYDILLAQSDRRTGQGALSTRAIHASPFRQELRLVASHMASFSSASRSASANWPSSMISITGSMRAGSAGTSSSRLQTCAKESSFVQDQLRLSFALVMPHRPLPLSKTVSRPISVPDALRPPAAGHTCATVSTSSRSSRLASWQMPSVSGASAMHTS